MKTFLKSMNIWQSYKQERDCLVHLFRQTLRDKTVLSRRRVGSPAANLWFQGRQPASDVSHVHIMHSPPGPRLPSQPQVVTAIWPIPVCTA